MAFLYLAYLIFISGNFFWDFQRYIAVISAMAAGASPYDHEYITNNFSIFQNSPLAVTFLYPPLVAELFYKLSWIFTTTIGRFCLIVISGVSWISIPYLLAGSPKKWYSTNYLCIWGLYLILFGFAGIRIFAVGNIAELLNAIMILAIVTAVQRNNYTFFWLAISVCAMVKIYFLVFLLMGIVLNRKYIPTLIFLVLFAATYSMNYVFSPTWYSQYVTNMEIVAHSPDVAGWSLFSLVLKSFYAIIGSNKNVAVLLSFGIHFCFAAIVILVAIAVSERFPRPYCFDLLCCWYFLSAFLISPRIFDYDVAVISVPFVLLGRMLLIERDIGLVVALSVAVCGLMLIRTPLADGIPAMPILGVWLGVALHLLSKEKYTRSQRNSAREPPLSPLQTST
jgi:hypothetical protein